MITRQQKNDANAVCSPKSKPCKGFSGKVQCIPKNRICRSEAREKAQIGKSVKEGAAFVGGGLATGAITGVGATIASNIINGKPKANNTNVNIDNKIKIVSEIRKKNPSDRTPEEKEVLKEQKESIVSNVLARKFAKTLGLELDRGEESAFADDIKEMIQSRRKNKNK